MLYLIPERKVRVFSKNSMPSVKLREKRQKGKESKLQKR